MNLLYLHGFRSSPQSAKARQMGDWMRANPPEVGWWCPQLPPSPAEAIALIERGIADWPSAGPPQAATALSVGSQRSERGGPHPLSRHDMAVVGSSLGGFYATVIAERTGCPAVLLNPAIDPAASLTASIGEQTGWQNPDERFFFKAEFIDELRAMTPTRITAPERYFAVIAKGDEVLDWRQMTGRYPGATIKLLEGGDHALSDFDDHLPDVLRFLKLA